MVPPTFFREFHHETDFCMELLANSMEQQDDCINRKYGKWVEMFYLNTIEQLFLFVEQLDQLEVCLAYRRLPAGIPILAVFQNLRWNSNKTSLQ